MKYLLLASLLSLVVKSNTCEHCYKLCQFNFDYLPLVQQGYCASDLSCENFLRDLTYRYFATHSPPNPCLRDPYHNDCYTYSAKVCTEIVGEHCRNSQSSEKRVFSIKDQLNRASEETYEVESQLRGEVQRQKQRLMHILDELNSLQSEI
mmetsp:Transcript_6722/g.9915  ORF Transcript_6722/g.9915 Transcript_6722/m.9915 type:complete len:150 (-) Transcript_6722:30-479(-)